MTIPITTPTTAPTQTLEQALLKMQEMPATKRREIFDFIDFIAFCEQSKPQNRKTLTGAALVEIFADSKLTDDEIAAFNAVRQDDNSEPVRFD